MRGTVHFRVLSRSKYTCTFYALLACYKDSPGCRLGSDYGDHPPNYSSDNMVKIWFGGGEAIDKASTSISKSLTMQCVTLKQRLCLIAVAVYLDMIGMHARNINYYIRKGNTTSIQDVRERFGGVLEEAASGNLQRWRHGYEALAGVILRDQFTRWN